MAAEDEEALAVTVPLTVMGPDAVMEGVTGDDGLVVGKWEPVGVLDGVPEQTPRLL